MSETAPVLGLMVLTAVAAVVSAQSSGQVIRAEVQNPLAEPYSTDDPATAASKLKLGLRLTNRSRNVVHVPKSETADAEAQRIALVYPRVGVSFLRQLFGCGHEFGFRGVQQTELAFQASGFQKPPKRPNSATS